MEFLHLKSVVFWEPFTLDFVVQKFTNGSTTFPGSPLLFPPRGRKRKEPAGNKVDHRLSQSPAFFVVLFLLNVLGNGNSFRNVVFSENATGAFQFTISRKAQT